MLTSAAANGQQEAPEEQPLRACGREVLRYSGSAVASGMEAVGVSAAAPAAAAASPHLGVEVKRRRLGTPVMSAHRVVKPRHSAGEPLEHAHHYRTHISCGMPMATLPTVSDVQDHSPTFHVEFWSTMHAWCKSRARCA